MQQVVHFRELMGTKDFMNKTEAEQQRAVDGLAFAYTSLALDTPDSEVERCAAALNATLTELTRRQFMWASLSNR